MDFSTLKQLAEVYPMLIKPFKGLSDPSDSDITLKINTIVQYLNQIGQVSNDTVNSWNKVMVWTMDEGLTDSVNAKIDDMVAKGTFNDLLTSLTNTLLGSEVLGTVSQDVKGAINEVLGIANANTLALGSEVLVTTNKDVKGAINEVKGIADVNTSSLADSATKITNRKVFDLGKYYGDTTTDMVDLITQQIAAGYTHFLIPPNTKFNKTLVISNNRDLNITLEGTGRAYGTSSGYADIWLNTGGIGIKITGSNNVMLKNLTLSSYNQTNPSKIGVLQQRSSVNNFCQWYKFQDVHIRMHSDYTANGGNGTIGLYNNTAESGEYNNLHVRADIPAVVTISDIYGLADYHGAVSMKDATFSGYTELNASKSYALVLDGVASFVAEQLFITVDAYQGSSTAQYGILVTAPSSTGYESDHITLKVDCEVFPSLLQVTGKMRNANIHAHHQGGNNAIIQLNANGFIDNGVIRLARGTAPTNPTIDLINCDSSSLGIRRSVIFGLGDQYTFTSASPIASTVFITDNKMVSSFTSTVSYFNLYNGGFAFNGKTMKWSFSQPSTTGASAGDITFNTNTALGGLVGWIFDGTNQSAWGQIAYKQSAGTPVGVLTPSRIGEDAFDNTNKVWYKSVGLTNADWKQTTN